MKMKVVHLWNRFHTAPSRNGVCLCEHRCLYDFIKLDCNILTHSKMLMRRLQEGSLKFMKWCIKDKTFIYFISDEKRPCLYLME